MRRDRLPSEWNRGKSKIDYWLLVWDGILILRSSHFDALINWFVKAILSVFGFEGCYSDLLSSQWTTPKSELVVNNTQRERRMASNRRVVPIHNTVRWYPKKTIKCNGTNVTRSHPTEPIRIRRFFRYFLNDIWCKTNVIQMILSRFKPRNHRRKIIFPENNKQELFVRPKRLALRVFSSNKILPDFIWYFLEGYSPYLANANTMGTVIHFQSRLSEKPWNQSNRDR